MSTLFTQPLKLYPVHMLRKERVCTDGRGFNSEVFEAGQDAQVPLETARSLVRDHIAKWIGQAPPETDDATEAFLAEEQRKAKAFPGFTAARIECPVVHFSHHFAIDNKLQSHDFVALFVDFAQWDQAPDWFTTSRPEGVATWDAISQMSLTNYIEHPASSEMLGYVMEAFVGFLSGDVEKELKFAVAQKTPNRVTISSGTGGIPGFLLTDAGGYGSVLRSGVMMKDLEPATASRYAPIWIHELLLWQHKR